MLTEAALKRALQSLFFSQLFSGRAVWTQFGSRTVLASSVTLSLTSQCVNAAVNVLEDSVQSKRSVGNVSRRIIKQIK